MLIVIGFFQLYDLFPSQEMPYFASSAFEGGYTGLPMPFHISSVLIALEAMMISISRPHFLSISLKINSAMGLLHPYAHDSILSFWPTYHYFFAISNVFLTTRQPYAHDERHSNNIILQHKEKSNIDQRN